MNMPFPSGVKHVEKPRAPLLNFLPVAFTYILATFSSNFSLQFVNYPTQVLGKSCKMVPGSNLLLLPFA